MRRKAMENRRGRGERGGERRGKWESEERRERGGGGK